MSINPLGPVWTDPLVSALPKADLHVHQEAKARFERVVAQRHGRPPLDRTAWVRRVLDDWPPGLARLDGVYEPDASLDLGGESDLEPHNFVARLVDLLEEAAADGAVLVEVRFGAGLAQPDFMALFREAERQVQSRYPQLHAEAIGFVNPVNQPEMLAEAERQLQACLWAARDGLAGVDFRVDPYETEADPALWEVAHRLAERAASVGLGITIHTGEFSTDNLAAALRTPGLKRVGHGVHAAYDAGLLGQLAEIGATVEFSLTSNVILGAVRSYEDHPIRRFVEAGIPVTLNTDLPVHVCTTIGREYAIAASLGFTASELLGFTRNAVKSSFTSAERRAALLDELNPWEARLAGSQ